MPSAAPTSKRNSRDGQTPVPQNDAARIVPAALLGVSRDHVGVQAIADTAEATLLACLHRGAATLAAAAYRVAATFRAPLAPCFGRDNS
ncbi:MAG: hypothetical protein L0H70_09150 [Xanthomonadales bacterium]|nr:hypothetical protein [Xanthomonadales bacterium]